MGERVIIDDWARFKALKTELDSGSVAYEFYQIQDDDNCYYLAFSTNNFVFVYFVRWE